MPQELDSIPTGEQGCLILTGLVMLVVGGLLQWWECNLGNADHYSWRGAIGIILCVVGFYGLGSGLLGYWAWFRRR